MIWLSRRSLLRPRFLHAPTLQSNVSAGALRFDQELPISHDLFVIHPNVELSAYNIDVSRRVPLRPSVSTVRIAKRDVHAGILLVLQDLADHILQFNIRADRKFAHAIAVLVGVGVAPEILFQFRIWGVRLNHAISLHSNGQRMLTQTPKLGAKPIAYDAVNYKRSVDLTGRGKNFSAWQVPPFVRANDPAGFHPAIIRIQIRNQIGARRRFGSNLLRSAYHVDDLDANAVHLQKVGSHSLQHD